MKVYKLSAIEGSSTGVVGKRYSSRKIADMNSLEVIELFFVADLVRFVFENFEAREVDAIVYSIREL
jgi:hypothetical protein